MPSSSFLNRDCHVGTGYVAHLAGDTIFLLETFGIVIAFVIDIFGKADYLFGTRCNAQSATFAVIRVNGHSGHNHAPFLTYFSNFDIPFFRGFLSREKW
jgi:hypothetical protein